ncbi:MAG: hypothetical protein J2P17_10130, partial [Mycobacterium sp.]|nr:hypothetical protein [Mycobacterium sp.]
AWRGVRVPVVPLETQLVTMMVRRQSERLDATTSTAGLEELDLVMLQRAITDRRTDGAQFDVPDVVGRLLPDG